jgi:hypothetical protein
LLGLPLYIVSAEKIISDLVDWTFHHPTMWLALLGNSFLSFVGVRGIYNLTGLTTSLTTSLTITVRKFSSLIISAVFFSETAFDLVQWGGASLVLIGSVLYTSAPGASKPDEKKNKKKLRESSTVLRRSLHSLEEKKADGVISEGTPTKTAEKDDKSAEKRKKE